MAVHCNGDAAAEQLLRCYEQAFARYGRDIRPVMVHAQLLRPDQGAPPKALGDGGLLLRGPRVPLGGRARGQLRAGAGLANQPRSHGLWTAAWCSISTRIPQSSRPTWWRACGAPYAAGRNPARCWGKTNACLYGRHCGLWTSNAAYALFEEGQKGTLSPGKRADLVLLDRDPLSCPPEELKDIRVVGDHQGRGDGVQKRIT